MIKKKSPANVNLPKIYIGKYIQLMICKKDHIKHIDEGDKIGNIIDHLLSTVRNSKDTPPGGKYLRLSHEDEESELEITTQVCSGYLDPNAETKCKKKTDLYLYIYIEEGTQVYFCKSTHLLRYLIKYYLVRGEKPSKEDLGTPKTGKKNNVSK